MNLKITFAGGLAMYLTQFVLSMGAGPLIHEGVLKASYRATSEFWRPELNQDPPDMVALLPLWVSVGIVGALLLAAVYGAIRRGFDGPGWLRGAKFGFVVWLVQLVTLAGLYGVFNLPYRIWAWWALEGVLYTVVGGAVLGVVAAKVAPQPD